MPQGPPYGGTVGPDRPAVCESEANFQATPPRKREVASLTSSAAPMGGDSSRSPRRLRCWFSGRRRARLRKEGPSPRRRRCGFAVRRRARLRKKAPGAATACPAAVTHTSGLVITTDSPTVPQPADKTEGGKRRFYLGLNTGISTPQPR